MRPFHVVRIPLEAYNKIYIIDIEKCRPRQMAALFEKTFSRMANFVFSNLQQAQASIGSSHNPNMYRNRSLTMGGGVVF